MYVCSPKQQPASSTNQHATISATLTAQPLSSLSVSVSLSVCLSLSVCVCVCLRTCVRACDATQPIFKQSTSGLNAEFSFFKTSCRTESTEPHLQFILI